METIFKKYECKNTSGQTLFFLELVDYYHLSMYLWTSIPRSVIDNKDVNRMI